MKQEKELDRISDLVALWLLKIRTKNALNQYDINRISQELARTLLNEIYDYKLENLDRVSPNHPSVDLGDKKIKLLFKLLQELMEINHYGMGPFHMPCQ